MAHRLDKAGRLPAEPPGRRLLLSSERGLSPRVSPRSGPAVEPEQGVLSGPRTPAPGRPRGRSRRGHPAPAGRAVPADPSAPLPLPLESQVVPGLRWHAVGGCPGRPAIWWEGKGREGVVLLPGPLSADSQEVLELAEPGSRPPPPTWALPCLP